MSPPLPRSPDFTLPSSGAIPAQNTTNGQLLVMGAGFGCTGGLFILAAILYCIILCVQKRASTSCVGAYVPQNIDEFEQALELVRRGRRTAPPPPRPATFKEWFNAKFLPWGPKPVPAGGGGGEGGDGGDGSGAGDGDAGAGTGGAGAGGGAGGTVSGSP